MPGKSVSFTDEAYQQILANKPEGDNFSEFVEEMTLRGIEAKNQEKQEA